MVATTPFLYREHEQPYDYWRMTSFVSMRRIQNLAQLYLEKKLEILLMLPIVINEGNISKTLFARLLKFIILKLARFINSDSLFDFRESTFFSYAVCVRK